MDTETPVAHLEYLRLEALAAAELTGNEDVGQKQHLDLDLTRAFALLAASAPHVEREVAGPELAPPSLRLLGKDAPDVGVGFQVSDRIRARRATDRALVDEHHAR